MNEESIFSEADVVSSYGDKQAVEDGVLVAVTERDRVTTAVWAWLGEHLPSEGAPPNNWPVDMIGWFTGDRPLAAARGLIIPHNQQARRVWDENIEGGVFKLWAGHEMALFTELAVAELFSEGNTELWLIPNEIGGITLMFPSDY